MIFNGFIIIIGLYFKDMDIIKCTNKQSLRWTGRLMRIIDDDTEKSVSNSAGREKKEEQPEA